MRLAAILRDARKSALLRMRTVSVANLGGHTMFTLYFAPGSSSFAVHIALHEIGVPFEGKPMSFKNNDLRSPEYLAINPEGKVPTLVIDGRPLTEVAAILYYLAKRFPDAGLLPRDDIEADVGGAIAAGLGGILVRTGKYRRDALEASGVRPTAIVDSIAEVPGLLLARSRASGESASGIR